MLLQTSSGWRGCVRFPLPPQVLHLVEARNKLKAHYRDTDLKFTLDGNLVGDLGEAVAVELFGLKLTDRGKEGIDGFSPDGRSVQVKASGTNRGAAFRLVETCAQQLLFFQFRYDECFGEILYNGPEKSVRQTLPESWDGQRSVSAATFQRLDQLVRNCDRLQLISPKKKG